MMPEFVYFQVVLLPGSPNYQSQALFLFRLPLLCLLNYQLDVPVVDSVLGCHFYQAFCLPLACHFCHFHNLSVYYPLLH